MWRVDEMNFKVDFDKPPTLVGWILAIANFLLLLLLGVGCSAFIFWEVPDNSYFRALGINILIVLVCAYFNKESK